MQKIERMYGIGTYWWFDFFDDCDIAQIQQAIAGQIAQFEQDLSRFRANSLLSRLNAERQVEGAAAAALRPLLDLGLDYYHKTGGLFNIGIGSVLEGRGYDADYSFRADGQTSQPPKLDQLLQIDPDQIRLVGAGNIDLGGLGKGYLIDQLAAMLRQDFGLNNFIINGGGDIYAAGQHQVLLQHPLHEDQYLYKIVLRDQGFAASSPYKRRWKDQQTGQVHDHFVRSADVTSQFDAVYVVADRAVDADMVATALSVGMEADRVGQFGQAAWAGVQSGQFVAGEGFPDLGE